MLLANPLPTGSATTTKTMGIVRVAFASSLTTGVLWPTMTSGLSSTSSRAKRLHPLGIARREAIIYCDVAADDPSFFPQSLFKGLCAPACLWVVCKTHEKSNSGGSF